MILEILILAMCVYESIDLICKTYARTRQESVDKTISDIRKRMTATEFNLRASNNKLEAETRRANHHREKARDLRIKLRNIENKDG